MGESTENFDFQAGEVLLFDKELDWTSFDLVRKIRNKLCRTLKIKKLKVGHAGTLDPKATGLMILCTGKATKRIEEFQAQEKEYVATLKLGATTPSYDLESEEDQHFPTDHLNQELVLDTLRQFLGETDQVPPVFSAVKVDGKRAYTHARKGQEVVLQPKKITITELELMHYSEQEIQIRVVCSKGTYIRALARDIGELLQSGAYLIGLRRTRIGQFRVENAWEAEEFLKNLEHTATN